MLLRLGNDGGKRWSGKPEILKELVSSESQMRFSDKQLSQDISGGFRHARGKVHRGVALLDLVEQRCRVRILKGKIAGQ